MDRELILRRLRSVNNVTGSIVGTAAWCSLHIQHGPQICALITELMKDSTFAISRKAALLLVLHEILLSCTAGGVSDATKRLFVQSMANELPIGVKAVLYGGSGNTTSSASDAAIIFPSTLARVVDWWTLLRVFPATWLDDLTALLPPEILQAQGPAASSTVLASQPKQTAELSEAVRLLTELLAAGSYPPGHPGVTAAKEFVARVTNDTTGTTATAEPVAAADDNDILGSFF